MALYQRRNDDSQYGDYGQKWLGLDQTFEAKRTVRFGSQADHLNDNSLTVASEGKAAPRVEYFQNPNLSVSCSR